MSYFINEWEIGPMGIYVQAIACLVIFKLHLQWTIEFTSKRQSLRKFRRGINNNFMAPSEKSSNGHS